MTYVFIVSVANLAMICFFIYLLKKKVDHVVHTATSDDLEEHESKIAKRTIMIQRIPKKLKTVQVYAHLKALCNERFRGNVE